MSQPFLIPALDKFQEMTHLSGEWSSDGPDWDGSLIVKDKSKKTRAKVQVILQSRLSKPQLAELGALKKRREDWMIIAGKINPGIREQLRKQGINYLDSAGNLYIETSKLLLWLEGQKDYPESLQVKRRLFTLTGIRIVFHLLAVPDVTKFTYRELAEAMDVSLGSLNNAMQQLKAEGFLLKKSKSEWQLINREALLKAWISAYAERLRPKLLLGRFRFANKERQQEWKQVKLPEGTCWGGEPAAYLLTRYLRPAEWILNTEKDPVQVMKSLHLLPDKKGNVLVLDKWWSDALLPLEGETAPPLLVYSDLIAMGDARNFETAQKLYDEFLEEQL